MKVTLPDGSPLELPDGATGADAARAIGEGLARAALGVRQNGDLRDLDAPLSEGPVEIVTGQGPGRPLADPPRRRPRAGHGRPGALPGREDLDRPPDRRRLLLRLRVPRGREGLATTTSSASSRRCASTSPPTSTSSARDVPVAEAIERFKAEGQDYKVELIEDLVRDQGVETVSLYRNGPFTDLCRGPHGPGTKRIKAFKLTSVAGAYWRGDAEPPDAHAHLRHRLPLEGGSRRSTSSGSRRPARATTASWAASWGCSCSPTCRPGRRSGCRTGRTSGTS